MNWMLNILMLPKMYHCDKTHLLNWADGDKNFKKYLNYYAKHNSDIINPFIEQFLNMLNQKFEERALPKITI